MDMMNIYLLHPLLTNGIFVSIVGALWVWISKILIQKQIKNGKIEIEKESKKAQFELQRKYLLTEIKTRNLLEIYPQLFESTSYAVSPFVGYFGAILKKISENKEKTQSEILSIIFDYKNVAFGNDFGLNDLTAFSNFLASKSMFISHKVYAIAMEIKKTILILRQILLNEIVSQKYLKYEINQLLDLITRVQPLLNSLEDDREQFSLQMNHDLDPNHDVT